MIILAVTVLRIKILLDNLSNSGLAVVVIVTAGQLARLTQRHKL
jgi:hypothetical protein